MNIKIKRLASVIGVFTLSLGAIGVNLSNASAVDFRPPSDNKATRQGSGGSSRTNFTPSNTPSEGSRPSSRTNFTAPPNSASSTPATSFILPADLVFPAKGRPITPQTSN